MEGKDRPPELGKKKYEEKGKTVGLMCQLTAPIHHTGKVVIMDSGFGVLEGLLQLKGLGVHGSAVIKKRCYWPKYIDGENIKEHHELHKVGQADALLGMKDRAS